MKEVIKVGRQKTKVWEAYYYYCIFGDEHLHKSQFKIFLVFNGFQFYCPAVKTAKVVVNKCVAPFMESLWETLDLSNNIYEMLPTSGVSSAFGLIKSHLQAAHRLASKADLATGRATINSGDIPTQPKPVTVASVSQKRTSSTATVSTTEDEPPVKSTRLAHCQCYCGVQCTSKEDLEGHISQAHPTHDWMCSDKDCDKVLKDKNSLWRHFRHKHLNIFNFHCELCNHGEDEEATIKYHKDKTHGIPTNIRCENPECNKPFPQQNKLKKHQEICGHKMKTHPYTVTYCRKAFRSVEQLRHHNKTDHPRSDEEALRYICEFCAKQLSSKQALRRHKTTHK